MKYVIASSKPWHQEITKAKGLFENPSFEWVGSRHELVKKIEMLQDIRYIFFLHWNWIVPSEICENYECICFHMTDVPYGRGGSPLQNLIVRGHTNTKLTALRMVSEMDAGPIYQKRNLSLSGTAHEIYKKAGLLSYEIIQWMIENEPEPSAQEGDVVYFQRRKPEQSQLPITGSLTDLFNHIRMLDAPTYPYAFIEYGDFVLKINSASLDDEELTATVRISKKLN